MRVLPSIFKRIFFLHASIFLISGLPLSAQVNDTIFVPSITFTQNPDSGMYLFPPDTVSFRKILMDYTLKCPCSGGDGMVFIQLMDSTGELFELGRYITPFSSGLDLGADGFKWTYDVTDYEPLLHGNVGIIAMNNQQRAELTFVMIKGTPSRQVVSVKNLWNGNFYYGIPSDPIENHLVPVTVNIEPQEKMARVKITTTGHGWGGSTGCAEFCNKTHEIRVDGIKRFDQILWKDDCGRNALFPQGGSWTFNRSNWCPGDKVNANYYEITSFVTPGNPITINYDAQPFTYPNDGQFWPSLWVAGQLIAYGETNFTNDVEIEEIIAPSDSKYHNRYNPACGKPLVVIRNGGSAILSTAEITYWVEGGKKCKYTWTGFLLFQESARVELPLFDWSGMTASRFYAEAGRPNNLPDEYPANNLASMSFTMPPVYDSVIIMSLLTNNFASENKYFLNDENGTALYSRTGLMNDTQYSDTFHLSDGCYVFEFTDLDSVAQFCDGLDTRINTLPQFTETAGSLSFKRLDGTNIRNFQPDFGCKIEHQFMVGFELDQAPDRGLCDTIGSYIPSQIASPGFFIYPNPNPGVFKIVFDSGLRDVNEIAVYNILGKRIFSSSIATQIKHINISDQPDGVYIIAMNCRDNRWLEKIIVNRYR